MEPTLPLDQMTTEEQLQAIEEIWQDLCRTPDDVPSPSWHEDVLRAREGRAEEGASTFSDWNEAKKRIRDSAK